jgi:hypothetical protein
MLTEAAERCNISRLSPNGKYAALCKGLQVSLYEVGDCMTYITKWQVLDEINDIDWSPDSLLILCGQHKRGVVHVFKTDNFAWAGFINNGMCGISNSLFCRDSRQVLTFTSQSTSVIVYNLIEAKKYPISNPKYSKKGFSFSYDGKSVCLVLRESNNDIITVYNTTTWTRDLTISVDYDVSDVYYMPDNTGIVAWSSPIEYKFIVYDLQGYIIKSFILDNSVLGINKVKHTFNGSYFALCGYNHVVTILHHCSWIKVQEFKYYEALNTDTKVMKETSDFRLTKLDQFQIKTLKDCISKPQPTKKSCWSDSGRYFVSVLKSMPSVLWIWDRTSSQISNILILTHSLKTLVWTNDNLIWVCGENLVYKWEVNDVKVYKVGIDSINYIQASPYGIFIQSKSEGVYIKLTN